MENIKIMHSLIKEWKELLNVKTFDEVHVKMKRISEIAELIKKHGPLANEEFDK